MPPTRKEVYALVESVDPKTVNMLLRVFGFPATGENDTRVEYPTLACLAAYDWLATCGVLTVLDRQRAILGVYNELQQFAGMFVEQWAENGNDVGRRSPAMMTLFDFQYIRVHLPGQGMLSLVDLESDAIVRAPARRVLTSLACDLNVLLLRLVARMEEVRKRQESTNANSTARERDSSQGTPGPDQSPAEQR